jgi:tetraacyldisaccharide-1-P 4'-kinase
MHITPVEVRYWPDHHQYTPEDLELIGAWAHQAKLDALVTTEKDAVKLALLDADWPVPVAALRVNIEMLGDGDKILSSLIDKMLLEYEDYDEPGTDRQPSESY